MTPNFPSRTLKPAAVTQADPVWRMPPFQRPPYEAVDRTRYPPILDNAALGRFAGCITAALFLLALSPTALTRISTHGWQPARSARPRQKAASDRQRPCATCQSWDFLSK